MNPTPDARTVIEQLPGWLAHYNHVHPHRALGYRSPREYIAQTREAPSGLLEATTLSGLAVYGGGFQVKRAEHNLLLQVQFESEKFYVAGWNACPDDVDPFGGRGSIKPM